MNWTQLITDLRARFTLEQIGQQIGMSKGGVHDLFTGRAKTVLYATGAALVALHKREIARAKRITRKDKK